MIFVVEYSWKEKEGGDDRIHRGVTYIEAPNSNAAIARLVADMEKSYGTLLGINQVMLAKEQPEPVCTCTPCVVHGTTRKGP